MLPTIPERERATDAQHPWLEGATRASPPTGLVVLGAGGGLLAPGLREAGLAPDTVICHCLQVRLGTLQECIARGCTTREALARETGATTVCGGCTPRVAALVGETSGYSARLLEVREIAPSVRSFRFAPQDPASIPLRRALPGQHVVVSALIDGRWVSRPYTLTSPAGELGHHEITVKLEPQGELSSWLFQQRTSHFRPIHVTHPRGDFHVEMESEESAVFLVAGIGVTPALAAARTLAADRSRKTLHIDYSARRWDDPPFGNEFQALAAACPDLSLRLRVTGSGDRLREQDLRYYRYRYPDARYYICGPQRYQEDVLRFLAAAGVQDERINVEVFTLNSRTPPPSAAPRRIRDRAILSTGLVLLLAYLAQGAFGWSWPWLHALQEGETYRRWSGAVLLSFVAAQWVLPALRLQGRLRAAALAYPWHRWLGALAPAFFYAHAVRPGFGYLLALSWAYLANVAVGLADKTLVRDPAWRERYARLWLVPHVGLACLTVGLALFHLYVVFAYK